MCTHDWNLEQDRGRGWPEAEAELIALHPEREEQIRGFRKHWGEMVPYHYADSVELMERLIDQGEDVTMLTNFAADTFAEARGRFPFLKLPRGVTVSGEVGLVKPDKKIFDLHASTFGLEPAATLFIDDNATNVEAARAAGWQAVQYADAPTLECDLARYGIADVTSLQLCRFFQ